MASPHAPKTRSRTNLPSSISKLPHTSFFRIILPYILQLNKLKLPLKFVRRYGSEISSTAKLSLPDGHEWKVGVEKKRKEDGNEEEEIWFSDGWAEFMEHHSISKGFFLVFQYRGCSVFDVEIFDLTTCSISYPEVHFENAGLPDITVISVGGDGLENTLDGLKASGIVISKWLCKRIRNMYMKCKQGIEDAILASNPAYPSFIALLNSDDCGGSYRPVIPVSFAREHMLIKRGNSTSNTTSVVALRTGEAAEAKQWSVEVRERRDKSGSIFAASFGQAGWRQFNEDNNLGEGDVCLFHLVSPEDLVLDVSIFPAAR